MSESKSSKKQSSSKIRQIVGLRDILVVLPRLIDALQEAETFLLQDAARKLAELRLDELTNTFNLYFVEWSGKLKSGHDKVHFFRFPSLTEIRICTLCVMVPIVVLTLRERKFHRFWFRAYHPGLEIVASRNSGGL